MPTSDSSSADKQPTAQDGYVPKHFANIDQEKDGEHEKAPQHVAAASGSTKPATEAPKAAEEPDEGANTTVGKHMAKPAAKHVEPPSESSVAPEEFAAQPAKAAPAAAPAKPSRKPAQARSFPEKPTEKASEPENKDADTKKTSKTSTTTKTTKATKTTKTTKQTSKAPKSTKASKSTKTSKSTKQTSKKKKGSKKKRGLIVRRVLIIVICALVAAIVILFANGIYWEPKVSGQYYGSGLSQQNDSYVNPYQWQNLNRDALGRLHYTVDGQEMSRTGIDVSEFQGDINWHQVRNDGISFAMIRAGYRGSDNGQIVGDSNFRKNLIGAQMAGLDVGVYFYSQATSVDEAVEEANFVLGQLGPTSIEYPVAFDWEPASGADSRISDLNVESSQQIAEAFCQEIQNKGKTAVVYGNIYDLESLNYPTLYSYGYWLASYTDQPLMAIPCGLWQYSSYGTVSGIDGKVDMDIDLTQALNQYYSNADTSNSTSSSND